MAKANKTGQSAILKTCKKSKKQNNNNNKTKSDGVILFSIIQFVDFFNLAMFSIHIV